MRALAWAITLVALATPAAAQPASGSKARVALLPLDAGSPLEIYGQPVASEIARSLVAGGVDVVVVGPKMAVPASARLIVDGSIRAEGDAVALQVRVRDSLDGTVLETIEASAAGVGLIDRAAAELSARVLPIVRERIAKLAAVPPRKVIEPARAARPDPTMLFSVGIWYEVARPGEPLRAALGEAVEAWLRDHRRTPAAVEPKQLGVKTAPATVSEAKAERAIAFEILGYEQQLTDVGVAFARGRVRVRIADASGVAFDRVVVTDTIVGDKGITPPELAGRVARELLAILRPHLRKLEPRWH